MSTLITDSNELTHFTAVFSKHDLAGDIAPRLSCIEVEALAGLLRALGDPATANTWIQEHAADDELGDAHYQGDTLDFLVPIDPQDDLQCDSCHKEPMSPRHRWRGLDQSWRSSIARLDDPPTVPAGSELAVEPLPQLG